MIEVLCLIIGMVVGVGIFIGGFIAGQNVSRNGKIYTPPADIAYGDEHGN